MNPFDDAAGTEVRVRIVGNGSAVIHFPKSVTFERLIDKLQAQFGEAKNIGGPVLPKGETKR